MKDVTILIQMLSDFRERLNYFLTREETHFCSESLPWQGAKGYPASAFLCGLPPQVSRTLSTVLSHAKHISSTSLTSSIIFPFPSKPCNLQEMFSDYSSPQ